MIIKECNMAQNPLMLLCLSVLTPLSSNYSQNFIPNHGFEQSYSGADVEDGFEYVMSWRDFLTVDYHFDGLGGTSPDSKWGYQMPAEGTRMAGIRTYEGSEEEWHEYISVEFSTPLEAGKTYFVSMMISPSELSYSPPS